jgi:hypothetical protein
MEWRYEMEHFAHWASFAWAPLAQYRSKERRHQICEVLQVVLLRPIRVDLEAERGKKAYDATMKPEGTAEIEEGVAEAGEDNAAAPLSLGV